MAGNVIRGSQGTKQVFSVKAPLGGMKPDLPPSGQGQQDFLYQENIRRVGGVLIKRPGHQDFSPLDGEATGMVDFLVSPPNRHFFCGGLTSYYPGEGYRLWGAGNFVPVRLDLEGDSQEGLPAFSGYVSSLGAGTPGNTPTLFVISPPTATNSASYSALFTIPPTDGKTFNDIKGVVQVEQDVYVSVLGYTGIEPHFAIFRWDGLTLVQEFFHGGTLGSQAVAPRLAFNYRGSPVMVGTDSGGTTRIYTRSPSGVWSAAASLGTSYAVGTDCGQVFQDNLYLGSINSSDIYRWNGSAVTTLAPATTGIDPAAFVEVISMAVSPTRLYYSAIGTTVGSPPYLSAVVHAYDGTTWNVESSDFLTDHPTMNPPFALFGVGVGWYAGNLYANFQATISPGVYQNQLWRAQGNAISAAWTYVLALPAVAYTSPMEFR